jgi:LmbE family N-acetylglucosaminyl deacetylase
MKNPSSISCVVPAYNEEKTIGAVIDLLTKAKNQKIISEIIVVSDGSTDKTAETAKQAGADFVVKLKKNIGKGGAVLEGVKHASSKAILLLDADLIGLKEEHLKKISSPFLDNKADMVVGFFKDDKWQKILPQFSGQRIIAKSILTPLLHNKKFYRSRYNFEILLNTRVTKLKGRTKYIPLTGLSHIHKRQKYGFKKHLAHRVMYPYNFLWLFKKPILAFALVLLILFSFQLFLAPASEHLTLAKMTEPTKKEKTLVVVAHPDDEIIGPAGYIYNSIKNGAEVNVVILTNGDSNRWSAVTTSRDILPQPEDFIAEGKTRMNESEKALALVGVPKENIFYLGFPDRGLPELSTKFQTKSERSPYTKLDTNTYDGVFEPGTAYSGANLQTLLKEIINQKQPNIIITHHPEDKNPDHRATYNFVRSATTQLEKNQQISKPLVYSFLVHWKMSDYPHPFRLSENSPLRPPEELARSYNWIEYPISPEVEGIKAQAINTFKSQLTSPYLKPLLHSFIRTNELLSQMP